MLCSQKIRQRIAVGALFALMFSALSPAFAALQIKVQPTAFAELCTANGIKRVAVNDSSTQFPPHHKSIHCAWCMSSAAQVALTGPCALWAQLAAPVSFKPVSVASLPAQSAPIVSYRSQAPPVLA